MDIKIKVRNLYKIFKTDNGDLSVLEGLNLDVYNKEFVSIVGPSGCGKTTFLSIIAGLETVTSGAVYLDGKEITGPSWERGVIFQEDSILPWRTVKKNIQYGLELRGVSKQIMDERTERFLKLVKLSNFTKFYPKELSGGMKKRVAIASVFANNPSVLLMDEPFGGLDYPTKVKLQEATLDIWEKEKKVTLFVTHDIEEAIFLSERVIILVKGNIIDIIDVPFKRPRKYDIRTCIEMQKLKKKLWSYIEE